MSEISTATFRYRFQPEQNFIWVQGVGEMTDELVVTFFEFLLHHPDWRPGLNELVDFREASGRNLTPSAIRLVAHFSRKESEFKRTAIVAAGQLSFGLLRMYMTYADESPEEIRVFEEMSEALAWLEKSESDVPESWTEFDPDSTLR